MLGRIIFRRNGEKAGSVSWIGGKAQLLAFV